MTRKVRSKADKADKANGTEVRPDMQTKIFAGFVALVFFGTVGWIGLKVTDMAERMARLEVIVDKNWESRQAWERRWEERFARVEKALERSEKAAGNGK